VKQAAVGNLVQVTVYVSSHCELCRYARQVAESIQRDYPQVRLRLVDLDGATEGIPESVFATPTYLLDGQVWSLGNPSPEKIREGLGRAPAGRTELEETPDGA
jgi:hypothetical protein